MSSGFAALGELLAKYAQRPDRVAKCPECGGRLVATVSIYTTTPVLIREWGDGQRQIRHQPKLIATKAELTEQVADNHGEVDEREDLYCEHFHYDEGRCKYWIKALDLEFPPKEEK